MKWDYDWNAEVLASAQSTQIRATVFRQFHSRIGKTWQLRNHGMVSMEISCCCIRVEWVLHLYLWTPGSQHLILHNYNKIQFHEQIKNVGCWALVAQFKWWGLQG